MGIIDNYKLKIIAISVAIIFVTFIFYFLYSPMDRNNNEAVEVIIRPGDGLRMIADKLDEADLIKSELLFMTYVRLRREDSRLKAGRYLFSKSMNTPVIVSLIVGGKFQPDDLVVTIPEGLNVWETDKLLNKRGLILEGQFSLQFYGEEGYLFPDTYRVGKLKIKNEKLKSEIETDFIQELTAKMRENFESKTRELFKNLNLEKQKEIIIVASILEKEAKTEEDMRLVAGIIYKRLELGMPLQIDATVTYGSCLRNFQFSIFNFQKPENCDVTFQSPAEEIKIDGSYNTYTRKGLPAGPISNPGLKAITAALDPAPSDYLYYLSTRDGSRIIYSKTPAEHAVNRKKHLGI